MRAAIYARVSTEDQHCEMQLAELGDLARRNGWEVVEYVEKVSSRKQRPALERLLQDGKHRKFDVVMVWKLDRFGRRLTELVANIETLALAGVRFWCPGQNIDTDQRNPISRLTLQILGAVAEFERDLIQERTKAGIAQAQRAGKHCGRPAKVFPRDRCAVLRKQGLSFRAIGRKLGVSEFTVRQVLKTA